MTEKIDFVILWVDGADPNWKKERMLFRPENSNNGTSDNRYRDWDLMRYWFRGVERFAPWVNKIFFVTNGQVPVWLNIDHPQLRLVKHRDYIPEKYLPTFNSNVIELWLHQIPDLGERFVLFNDDMFLTDVVEPIDFFRDGAPCESALLDIATAPDENDCLPHMQINNFSIINKYFVKSEVLRKYTWKFFSLQYGKELLRNLLLCPFQYFSCFRDSHLPSSYLKSTFVRIWQLEEGILRECSNNRFRSKTDLTHWLMKCWQICEGNFSVRSIKWGHHFELWEDDIETICRSIIRQKYRVVCLNDSKTEIDFVGVKERLKNSFEYILPDKSEFEQN